MVDLLWLQDKLWAEALGMRIGSILGNVESILNSYLVSAREFITLAFLDGIDNLDTLKAPPFSGIFKVGKIL